MTKPLAVLVDADIIAYRTAAVCEERTVDVKHSKSGRIKNFPTRTEFKSFLKAKNFKFDAKNYEFTDVQQAQPVANALHTIKSQINSFKEKFKPDALRIILSGADNFREKLPLPKKYKGNREDMIRPLLLKECKEYLVQFHQAEIVDKEEADDALIHYGYEYKKLGYDVILISSDKDSRAYSGLSVWDFTKPESEVQEISNLGFLVETDKGIKGTGFLWYCLQMLNGDETDFYRPFESFGIKYGEKSAYKLLKNCSSEKEALEKIIQQYKTFIPEPFDYICWQGVERKGYDHINWLCLYHCCVRMRETKDDPLCFIEFCKRYGVTL